MFIPVFKPLHDGVNIRGSRRHQGGSIILPGDHNKLYEGRTLTWANTNSRTGEPGCQAELGPQTGQHWGVHQKSIYVLHSGNGSQNLPVMGRIRTIVLEVYTTMREFESRATYVQYLYVLYMG